MARTTTVKSARKALTCRVCREPINIGDPYKWTKPLYKGKIAAHVGCTIPPSMTSSSKMVAVWEAQETLNRSNAESVPEGLRDLATTAREVGGEYQESADSQREVFPDAEVAQENEDKAQGLDSWADELETAAEEAESELSELEELQNELAGLNSQEGQSKDDEDRVVELESEIEDKETEILAHVDTADECPV